MPQHSTKTVAIKAARFNRLFSTPDGILVLEDLRAEFDADNIHVIGDSHSTAYNLGRRDVVVYINQLRRYDDATRRKLEGQSTPGD